MFVCRNDMPGAKPRQVLLRAYCAESTDRLPRTLDLVIISVLSERKYSVQIYGVFDEGRFEEWIDGRTLNTGDIRDPGISEKIATGLAKMHSFVVPLKKTPDWLFKTLEGMLPKVMSATAASPDQQALLDRVLAFDLPATHKWLVKLLSGIKGHVGFCHNDLQEGNILEMPDKTLQFIDFEFVGYNMRYVMKMRLCFNCSCRPYT